ncbi:lipid II isoglutaminyl synthase subunit MurT [Lactococcus fujiensis]|uniref:Lipid II isoglutaminyl synthase (glutamine-hydrolyzing) subunit MurT n=1 Tax=Lactococcus fujiensis JCM 16395 TaxID=1291764 RepID=A0A2A5RK12_9LACT|nr:lipid II isoglutaminyl synthase subunit MurT [Lactococcus fujiensis]PCR99502.1 UDP-N-acetylmuramyl peptide synthase [Lactococcus fujiensis JCM 16395]
MTIKTSFAKAVGKTSGFVLEKFFKRGSTFPGKIALKFDPKILSQLTKNYEIIVITGTNGKTLTTALTVGILEKACGPVVTNQTGANMITGIVSTFLKAPKAKVGQKKYAVLEIDEASLPRITQYLKPSLFVFTNIFRDQMDRYGEIYTTFDFIVKGAAQAPEATILLNGDSPLFNSKKLVNPVKYYGFDHESHQPKRAHYNTEGVLCPVCHHILDFEMNTYANLGNYICQNCGFTRPQLDYKLSELTEITNTSSTFVIDDHAYKINVGGLYNIYNALAAVSVAEYYKIPTETIKAGFDQSKAVFGRQETFQVGQKSVTIVLIKNPVGANQALEMMKLAPYPFTLYSLLNADYADGIDTSWIWDAEFELINEMSIDHIYTGGVRHSEMARRYRVAGFDENKVTELTSLPEVVKSIENDASDHVYLLATYTAMLEIREHLAEKGYVQKKLN